MTRTELIAITAAILKIGDRVNDRQAVQHAYQILFVVDEMENIARRRDPEPLKATATSGRPDSSK